MMMNISTALVLALLGFINLSSNSLSVDAAQSLRVEMNPNGTINGCCSQAFYDATDKELSNYVNSTTTQVLQILGLSISNLVINKFVLVNSNSCLSRQRSLRANGKKDDERKNTLERKLPYYSSTCSACTKSSCSSYCSGCYLCASNRRRELMEKEERDLQLGGLLSGLLGVTTAVLNAAVAAITAGIQPHFAIWLTTGPGAALANGCMGPPNDLQILVSLA